LEVLSNGYAVFSSKFIFKNKIFHGFMRRPEITYRPLMTIRLGIAGITGRMGILLAQEVMESKATCSGGTSRAGDGAGNPPVFRDIESLAAISDIVIDFSAAEAVQPNAAALAAAGTGWVLGTTGLTPADEAAITAAAAKIPVVAAPNFSSGVNLVLALAQRFAASLSAETHDAEILEMHHRQKRDAPSGTALAFGRAVAAGRGINLADVMVSGRDGVTGPRATGEIGFATLRGGQIFGSHSLLMTAADEQIVLTHHAFDRRIFAAGALRAALWLYGKAAGRYAMADVLGLNE
jgi:4-hydroxy-tetrahydrodipicolinate reductase